MITELGPTDELAQLRASSPVARAQAGHNVRVLCRFERQALVKDHRYTWWEPAWNVTPTRRQREADAAVARAERRWRAQDTRPCDTEPAA